MTDMLETNSQESATGFDVAEARRAYSRMTTDELLFLVASGAEGYEEDVLELVLDELQARGIDRADVPENIRDLKARKYDELIASKEARKAERLPRWMTYLLFLDPTGVTVWILVYLGVTKRWRALGDGVLVAIIGWAIKAAAIFVVLQFSK